MQFALAKKKGKASRTSDVVTENLLASGDAGLERMTSIFNCILTKKRTPADWNTSIIENCFKDEGEATERGNCRGVKLLKHRISVEKHRIIEQEIRKVIDI